MSSTRYRQQPLQIYQDPQSYDHALMPSMPENDSKSSSPLRPIKNASSRRNVVLNPPASAASHFSPLKPAHQSSSSPLRASLGSTLNVIPMPPPGGPVFQTDSLEKKQPIMSKFKTALQKPLFTTFTTSYPSGKENRQTPVYSAPTQYNDSSIQHGFSLDALYGQKSPKKRALMEAAPILENPSKKPKVDKELNTDSITIPTPEQFPALHDDGTKPTHSYAQLIGMAILRAPNRRLTLAQIYKWISETYSYYSCADAGWQNSIRHNLSLNKAFVKQERPKDDPGKGNYWAIEVGMEKQFIKEKQMKKSSGFHTDLAPMISTTLTQVPRLDNPRTSLRSMAPAQQELPRSSTYMASEPNAPATADLSSDATIPASDAFLPEECQEEEEPYLAPPSSHLIQSSPPAMMQSSPPVVLTSHRRDDTPPPVPRFPTSSRTRSHKRNFASMDDSGYFSSLNSSAIRGHHGDRGQLTSEADRPLKSIKRGRAEEEIARLRGSSYDSPTKAHTFRHSVSFAAPPSSSPIRRGETTQMLPPLTPAIKLRPPPQAPPSVSPNTNLRLHRDRVRQLVGSPDRGLACLEESIPWSPAFQIEDSSYLDVNDFDIFSDINANVFFIPGNESPEKRSTKRPRTDRAHSTSILGNITNVNYNKNFTSAPMTKFTPPSRAGSAFNSPCRQFDHGSPLKFNSPALSMSSFEPLQEDFCGAEFLADELTEFSGMDIMQGFQKIGAGQGGSKGQNTRSGLVRSFSTRF